MNKFSVSDVKNQFVMWIERELGPAPSKKSGHPLYYCPFHQEDTPSFIAYEDGGHCFGCGWSGDTVDFIQKARSLSFKDACEYLQLGKTSEETLIKYKEERQKIQQQQEQRRLSLQEEFARSGIWETFHAQMTDQGRRLWRERGIPDSAQNLWKLGYNPDRVYEYAGEFHHSPAMTIPFMTMANGQPPKCTNMQSRLIHFPGKAGKYRFEPHMGTQGWIANPFQEPSSDQEVILLEGAIKAAVMYLAMEGRVQCMGAPSMSDSGGLIPYLKDYGRVTIWLDPEAQVRPTNAQATWRPWDTRWAEQIGTHKVRLIRYSQKADDYILAYGLNRRFLTEFMNVNARAA